MTTIAYRDGVMAADSMITSNDEWIMPYRCPKILRLPNRALVGFSGNLYLQNKFVEWLSVGGYPQPDLKDTSKAIVAESNGDVRLYQYEGYAIIEAPFFAIGCGTIPAMAAMHMGASAKRAIEIASILDNATGGEIQIEELDSKRMRE